MTADNLEGEWQRDKDQGMAADNLAFQEWQQGEDMEVQLSKKLSDPLVLIFTLLLQVQSWILSFVYS